MSRIAGRRPNASGQISTAGCAPVAGWMKAASQVPSAVLIVTSSVTTARPAADAVAAELPRPAATDKATKSRREKSVTASPKAAGFTVRSILQAPVVVDLEAG